MKKLTPKQAAEQAGVSANMIYIWTTVEKRLRHYRMGGRGRRGKIVIDEGDLLAFLETLKVEGEEPALATSSPKSGGRFTQLDPDRLLEAWQKQE